MNTTTDTPRNDRKTPMARSPTRAHSIPPVSGYEQMTIPEILNLITTLSEEHIEKLRIFERAHRRRKTLLVRLERRIRDAQLSLISSLAPNG